MSRYVQTGTVEVYPVIGGGEKIEPDFHYMGSAEFEFGSVSSALACLRHLNCTMVSLEGLKVLYKESPSTQSTAPLCIIAPDETFADGTTYLDRCIEDFNSDLAKAKAGQGYTKFKENPRYSDVVFGNGHAMPESLRSIYNSPTFWLVVDPFIMRNKIKARFSPEEATEVFSKIMSRNNSILASTEEVKSPLDLVYIVVRKDLAKQLCEALSLGSVAFENALDSSTVRMFDKVTFWNAKVGRNMPGKVVGLLEDNMFRIETAAGRVEVKGMHLIQKEG